MIVSQTPLRISFAGGATDFARYYREHEGLVVSAAIDKYIYVIVSPRFDDLIYVNYSKKEIVKKVGDLKHELVREALVRTGIRAASRSPCWRTYPRKVPAWGLPAAWWWVYCMPCTHTRASS